MNAKLPITETTATKLPNELLSGNGFVFHNPATGIQYSAVHPLVSGECPDATDVRASTAMEDALASKIASMRDSEQNAVRELAATVRKFNADNEHEFWLNIATLRRRAQDFENKLVAAVHLLRPFQQMWVALCLIAENKPPTAAPELDKAFFQTWGEKGTPKARQLLFVDLKRAGDFVAEHDKPPVT